MAGPGTVSSAQLCGAGQQRHHIPGDYYTLRGLTSGRPGEYIAGPFFADFQGRADQPTGGTGCPP